jgi:hypothetical protein
MRDQKSRPTGADTEPESPSRQRPKVGFQIRIRDVYRRVVEENYEFNDDSYTDCPPSGPRPWKPRPIDVAQPRLG